ncbi:MAG: carbohydrate ABC transporter permease [Clostridiales bacterium]|nr:carbohydrate ABC transporter permease [Clostridiales bacterium]
MRRKSSLNRWTTFDTVVTLLAVLVCFITIYPMWYVLIMSFSDPVAASSGSVTFLPVGFTLDAYDIVLGNERFWRSLLNSVLYVIIGVILMLITTVSVAYPLTRSNLKGRKLLSLFLIIPMYFGGGMIPSFILITKLGWYNSPLALIVPGCYSIWNIILCRTYLASIPNELSEAAFIDGATNMQALWKIYLPLAKPVLAVITIYTIVGIWNSWFSAVLYTTRQEIQPAQVYLRSILNASSMADLGVNYSEEKLKMYMERMLSARQIKYTVIVIVTLPILMVYPMFQKHFTKGVMLGSLKG